MAKQDSIIGSAEGYQLLDFGAGRKLERFGDVVVDRPAPQATAMPTLTDWQADVVYAGSRVADGEWSTTQGQEWLASIDGQDMHCRLGRGGQVGVYPEHIACWRWLRERLKRCKHNRDIKVLNLFAGTGGASLAAMQAGARVTHVDAQASQLELARLNCGDKGVRFIRDNVMTYVERLLRQGERFHMIIMDPPSFGRGGKSKLWDIRSDLQVLINHLPRLLSDDNRGVWLSLHTKDIQAQAIVDLLNQALPGQQAQALQMGTQTADGRVLSAGVAAVWYDDSHVQ
jgi:23S rRNA (cytosine1962-C5)-methyltransferase